MALTRAELEHKVRASNRNWDQLCQALVYNVSKWTGGAEQTYGSAKSAYQHSSIVSKNTATAPIGAVHYWDIGKYGHVAVGLGGGRVLMGSKYVDEKWGTNVGTTTVSAYSKRTGARYLGWAHSNGVNRINIQVRTTSKAHTTAQAGEGLHAIADRSGISFDTIRELNPDIKAPRYVVQLGQKVRIK